MTRNRQPVRNPTPEILGIALLAVLVFQLVSHSTRQEPDAEAADVSAPPPKATFVFTSDGIKALSPSIRDARLTAEAGDGAAANYRVAIAIHKQPLQGAADWNSVAHDVRSLSEFLLDRPEPVRIDFSFSSPESGGTEWARSTVLRTRLPENWRELTYLQFFSRTDAEPATADAAASLCAFYHDYANSRPSGAMPDSCPPR